MQMRLRHRLEPVVAAAAPAAAQFILVPHIAGARERGVLSAPRAWRRGRAAAVHCRQRAINALLDPELQSHPKIGQLGNFKVVFGV